MCRRLSACALQENEDKEQTASSKGTGPPCERRGRKGTLRSANCRACHPHGAVTIPSPASAHICSLGSQLVLAGPAVAVCRRQPALTKREAALTIREHIVSLANALEGGFGRFFLAWVLVWVPAKGKFAVRLTNLIMGRSSGDLSWRHHHAAG